MLRQLVLFVAKRMNLTLVKLVLHCLVPLLRSLVKNGQSVTKGEPLIVTEAMKMETTITAPIDGIVEEILVREGSRIESGDCLLRIEDALKR